MSMPPGGRELAEVWGRIGGGGRCPVGGGQGGEWRRCCAGEMCRSGEGGGPARRGVGAELAYAYGV
jgi:hypothetical protein